VQAILVAVLVIAAGLFLTLFLIERGAAGKAQNEVTSIEEQIAGEREKLAEAKSTVEELQEEGEQLQGTNEYLKTCDASSRKTLALAGTNNDAEFSAAFDQMVIDCARRDG
jgi:cell division protein FtsB